MPQEINMAHIDMNLTKTMSSLDVAKTVDRRHDQVVRDIRNIISQIGHHKSVDSYFMESTYKSLQNKDVPYFLLTKKGCELYATRMNGTEGTLFAIAYIEKFNQMEEKEKQIVLPNDPMAILKLTFDAQEQTNTRVESLEETVSDIVENQLLNTADYNSIGSMIQKKIYITSKERRLNQRQKKELFKDINGSIKKLTGSNSRSRIRAKDYDKVINFIDRWQPSSITLALIDELAV